MSTVRIDGWIYLDTAMTAALNEPKFSFFTGKGTAFSGYEPVVQHTIEFDLPEGFDPREPQIKALERRRTEARAAFQATMTEIEARISKLLAIEHVEAA